LRWVDLQVAVEVRGGEIAAGHVLAETDLDQGIENVTEAEGGRNHTVLQEVEDEGGHTVHQGVDETHIVPRGAAEKDHRHALGQEIDEKSPDRRIGKKAPSHGEKVRLDPGAPKRKQRRKKFQPSNLNKTIY
jgi:hypothetical protein